MSLTCLKWREALMKVARHVRRMAVSSQCRSSAPLSTLRNRGRSPASVNVLDILPNILAISWKENESMVSFVSNRYTGG